MATSFGLFTNFALSFLSKKITVPGTYHSQCKAIKVMLADDCTGLIDSLTDFAVESANVSFSIKTENDSFTDKLNYWLENINGDFNGQIPRGINALAKEYFKERWKASSFPVLKILKWKSWQGIAVPSQMCIVDGESVYSEELNGKESKKQLLGYRYSVGAPNDKDSESLDSGVIITKPFARWFDEYPVPFLIKRGIYHNYQIIKSLKSTQTTILDQIIPYMFLIKKGTEGLALGDSSPKKSYSQPELDEVVQQFQDMMDELKGATTTDKQNKSPIRATQFDEDLKHFMPDMEVVFKKTLFETTEKNILCGLGFIDVIEATSNTRREAMLNPKIFIEDVKTGVKDFKEQYLGELVKQIVEKNKKHRKYANSKVDIISSPVTAFMTEKFKQLVKQMYTYGKVSAQTAVEVVAELDFATEVHRIESEKKLGYDEKLYPPVIRNDEGKGIDIPGKETPDTDKNNNEVPDDKTDPTKKKEYNVSAKELQDIKDLVGAPYHTIKELPDEVKKLSIAKQRVWMRTWNSAYKYYLGKTDDKKEAEKRAFATAWSVVNKKTSKK